MRKRWATKVMEQCIDLGFTFHKDEGLSRWQMREGEKVFYEARALGDVLRKVGNDLEITVD